MWVEISSQPAYIYCLAQPIAFVGSLYLWRLFSKRSYERNHPIEVQRRFISVSVICVLSPLLFISLFTTNTNKNPKLADASLWTYFGVKFDSSVIVAIISVVILNSVLFLGSLVQKLYVLEHEIKISKLRPADINELKQWYVAPFVEEIIFRACMIMPLIVSGESPANAIYYSPLLFGIAHGHKILEHLGSPDLKNVILEVIFQVAYTTIFGIYVGYVYVNTGSLLAAICLHSYCNMMGFPELQAMIDQDYEKSERIILQVSYAVGLIAFFYSWGYLMDPTYYDSLFYKI